MNTIVSRGNVGCMLVSTCEILITTTPFLVALVTRRVQFWTLSSYWGIVEGNIVKVVGKLYGPSQVDNVDNPVTESCF